MSVIKSRLNTRSEEYKANAAAMSALVADLREKTERLLPQIRGIQAVPVSAETGRGLDKLMQAAGAATAAPATVEVAPVPRVNPGAAVATPDAPPQSERSAPGDVRTRGNLGSRERGER